MWSLFIDFQDEFQASRSTRLEAYHWDFQRENMLYYLSRPGIKQWWDRLEMKLDPEFVAFANQAMGESEYPDD